MEINDLVMEVYLGSHNSIYKRYYKTGFLQKAKIQLSAEKKQIQPQKLPKQSDK